LGREPISWDKLVLATGYFDYVNKLGVPDEDLPHVHHYFDEAHLSYGLDVVVIGGKNSRVEAALQCFARGTGHHHLSRHDIGQEREVLAPSDSKTHQGGEIQARLGSQVVEITARDVLVRGALGTKNGFRRPGCIRSSLSSRFRAVNGIANHIRCRNGTAPINPATLKRRSRACTSRGV